MLDQQLIAYAQSDIYPFHMPGHKRQTIELWNPYQMDITEIDGFDNLHRAEGILKEAQNRAAQLYGAKQSFYLINGSTCGLLTAICAVVPRRQKVLVARNCHKAVYHAIELWELSVDYVYPEMTKEGISGQVSVQKIASILEKSQNQCPYAAVIITSPTYDGVVSDISEIAKIVHKYDIPLIVDEAHGAHFSLSDYFPKSAVQSGADIVIQSMHKTLPSFTQTALLHVCSSRISVSEVERYLDIFETSSPSYVLMAGMESCIRLLQEKKEQLFQAYWEKLSDFYKKAKSLQYLRVIQPTAFSKRESYVFDASKILIFTDHANLTGKQLYDILLNKYQLQMEMVSRDYVLAMTSIMDTQDGFERLYMALQQIDETLEKCDNQQESQKEYLYRIHHMDTYQKQIYKISEAESKSREMVNLNQAAGRISAEYIYLYPPGIPFVTPGEQITEDNIKDLKDCISMGLEIYGLSENEYIHVIREQ